MAHELTNTDGLVLTGKPAWHGIGTVVQDAPTPQEALKLAGLDWLADKRELHAVIPGTPITAEHAARLAAAAPGIDTARLGDPSMLAVPSHKAIIRSDNRNVLGIVGDGYVAFQNHELADMANALGQRGDGTVKVETAGSLKGGRTVFFLVRTGEFGVGIGKGDRVQTYGLFTSSHDGSGAIRAHGTSVRVVCANTMRAAERGGRGEGLTIRHTKSLTNRVAAAKAALAGIAEASKTYEAQAGALADRGLTSDTLKGFFLDVYQTAYAPIVANPKDSKEERSKRKAVETVAAWVAKLDEDNQQTAGTQGTAWAALNAVTEWADHDRPVRATQNATQSEAKTWARLFGAASGLKQTALDTALALV